VTAAAPEVDLVWLGDRPMTIVEGLQPGGRKAVSEAMRQHARQVEELVLEMDDAHLGHIG
jgi:DNA-binding FadR family transcriptional regulator